MGYGYAETANTLFVGTFNSNNKLKNMILYFIIAAF
jgi:hypothetical protein